MTASGTYVIDIFLRNTINLAWLITTIMHDGVWSLNACGQYLLRIIEILDDNHSHGFLLEVITHRSPNFNDSLTKPPFILGHGWVYITHMYEYVITVKYLI